MAQNKQVRFGPVAITAAVANVLNPPTITGGTGVATVASATYVIVRHIRIVNTTSAAVSISMWIGATGGSVAGTQFLGTGLSIPANTSYDWYGMLRLDVVDFLTAQASAVGLTFEAEGEIGIA